MAAVDLMAAMYAAVTAIEEGKVGEVELEHRVEDERGDRVEVLLITVRRDVKHFQVQGGEA